MSTPCNKEGSGNDCRSIDRTRSRYEEDRQVTIAELSKEQGKYFEQIASSVVVTHIDLIVDPKFTPPTENERGIDLFCRHGDKIAIVEVKADQQGINALEKTAHGMQNSIEWIYAKAEEMVKSDNPRQVELGKEILSIPQSAAQNQIERYVVTGKWEGKGDSTDFVIEIFEGNGASWDSMGSFSGIDIGIPMLDK
jgi:hypothetical protein